MIYFIINTILSSLNFSKTESKGTLALIFIVIIALFFSSYTIRNSKKSLMVVSDKNKFVHWASEVQASYALKKTNYPATRVNRASKSNEGNPIERSNHREKEAPQKEAITEIKDLNNASARDLKTIKGIGNVYSKRIIKFRDRLGGFSNMNQLSEVYGMTPELMKKITARFHILSDVQTFDFNNDSVKLLIKHPYISYDLAWILINYRKQHGDIKNMDDLAEIKAIDDSLLQKLRPYVD